MSQIRPLPIVASVVACEAVLALVGSEVEYRAEHHQLSNSGALGVLLRSVGAPLAAPWHSADWQFGGPASLAGVLVYLLVLATMVWVITRGARPDRPAGVIFLGTWAACMLSLFVGELVRILITSGSGVATALAYAPALTHHGAYFGWVPATIAAGVAGVTGQLMAEAR